MVVPRSHSRSVLWAGLALVALGLLALAGCGVLEGLWTWDDTCYDCRTVCSGTLDDERDACLASCSECQGYSECFAWLEWRFEGMENPRADWTPIDCTDL